MSEPVTRGVTSSTLPVNPFTGVSSNVSTVDATPPSEAAGTLTASSSLNQWLGWLGSQNTARISGVSGNASAISTLAGRVTTAEGDITTLQGTLASTVVDLDAAEAAASTLTGRVTTAEGDISANTADIAVNAAAISAITVPSVAGLSQYNIPYWSGTAWLNSSINFNPTTNIFRLGGATDGHLGVSGTGTNIFVVQNSAQVDAFVVPQTGAVRAEEMDIRITESGTAAKGIVLKDRTSGVYKRLYIENGAVAIENS